MKRYGLLLGLALARTVAAEPAVWHIEPTSQTEIWLLGSVHYLREEDHPLPEIVSELYAGADELVMEIDLDDLDPLAVQTRFMQAAMLPAATPLSSVLSSEVYSTAAMAAGELGIDISALEPFEPWFVALTLMDLGMARLGMRADQGLEQTLLHLASRDSKNVRGLETLEDQLGVFDELSISEQEALLAQTLEEINAPQSDMDELLTAWRDGRLETLSGKLLESFDEFPRLYQSLIVARNKRWIAEIERLAMQPGRYLIVVGALHLVGDNSVVDLLNARGHEVIRLAP